MGAMTQVAVGISLVMLNQNQDFFSTPTKKTLCNENRDQASISINQFNKSQQLSNNARNANGDILVNQAKLTVQLDAKPIAFKGKKGKHIIIQHFAFCQQIRNCQSSIKDKPNER